MCFLCLVTVFFLGTSLKPINQGHGLQMPASICCDIPGSLSFPLQGWGEGVATHPESVAHVRTQALPVHQPRVPAMSLSPLLLSFFSF